MRFATVDDIAAAVGADLGRSRTIVVDQQRIDRFADVTEDRQWIHTDAERAAHGPFGTTIAHGYLTLSLVSTFLADLFDVPAAASLVNYGLDRVRFPAPVRAGSSLVATGTVRTVHDRGGDIRADLRIVIEDGGTVPVCVADVVVLVRR